MPAAAQETGFYVGASIGQSEFKDACSDLPAGFSCDEKDTAWKIFGGYQFNRHFAAELGYNDLGEVSASGFGLTAATEVTAWELVAVGSFPVVDRFSVYGKLGAYRAETEFSSNILASEDETNSGLTFGLGVRYDITRNLGVRGEWQRYNDVGDENTTGEGDLSVLSIGIVWKF